MSSSAENEAPHEPIRVIVTRPPQDAAELAARLTERGLAPIICPAMQIEWLSAAQARPLSHDAVGLAFTSANGVRAFEALFLQNGSAKSFRDLPVYAVGQATADAAERAGFRGIHTGGGELSSLTALIAKSLSKQGSRKQGPIIHIAGSDRAGDLIKALHDQGINAERVVLYKAQANDTLTTGAEHAIKSQARTSNADHALWVALFSPRTADIFLKQIETAELSEALCHVNAACLSEAVAARLKGASFKSIKIAKTPITKDLIDLITHERPPA